MFRATSGILTAGKVGFALGGAGDFAVASGGELGLVLDVLLGLRKVVA